MNNQNFDEWRKQNPFAWYPGCGRTQVQHAVAADFLLDVVSTLDEFDGKERTISGLKAQIPAGMMGPFTQDESAVLARARGAVNRARLQARTNKENRT